MAGSIELFKSTKLYYQTLGILPEHQSNIFNFRNLFVIFCYFINGISSLVFFLLEAHTISEFGITFYAFVSELSILYFLLVQMWQMPNILALIASFDQFIAERKHLKHFEYNIF